MTHKWCTRLLVATLLLTPSAYAVTLAGWTFEVSGPGLVLNDSPTSPIALAENGLQAGVAPCNGVHASSATDWSSPVGNGSSRAFSSNAWAIGDYYQVQVSTAGYENITFAFDQTRSSTGPGTFDVAWSTDGTTWNVLVDNYSISAVTWSSTTYNAASSFGPYSLPAGANNQPTLYIRLVCQDSPAAGGTNRVDNLVVTGELPAATGACCLLGGGCVVNTAAGCGAVGGAYQGDGTTCDPNPCTATPLGACCLPTGGCIIDTEVGCNALAGLYQGDGTACDPNPCITTPTGACCRSGVCNVLTEADCNAASGVYQGDGTTCTPNPCPPPTGACCVAGCCVENVTLAQCNAVSGSFQGEGSACTGLPAPCPIFPGRFLLTELLINAPGADQGREWVEIQGPPLTSLAGYWLIVIEGDTGPAGTVDQLIDLSAYSTGANGLLLIRDDVTGPALVPPADPLTNVVYRDFVPDIENGSNTYVLAKGIPNFAVGTDLDTNNDGTLDSGGLPGLCPVDAVSYLDPASQGGEYADDLGGDALGVVGTFTPDALYRLFDCQGNPWRWAGGDITGTAGVTPWTWDPTQNFGLLPEINPADLPLDGGIPNYQYCPPTTGACCFPDGSCQVLTADACDLASGNFLGTGTDCGRSIGGNPCPQPPVGCPGDSDCDGDVDFDDIDFFVAALSGEQAWIDLHIAVFGQPPTCPYSNNDVNGVDGVNFDDIDAFVAAIGTICP